VKPGAAKDFPLNTSKAPPQKQISSFGTRRTLAAPWTSPSTYRRATGMLYASRLTQRRRASHRHQRRGYAGTATTTRVRSRCSLPSSGCHHHPLTSHTPPFPVMNGSALTKSQTIFDAVHADNATQEKRCPLRGERTNIMLLENKTAVIYGGAA